MAINFEKYSETHIRAFSTDGKYLIEHPSGIEDYVEAINRGTYINETEGYFENGNTYTESEKYIPVIEEPKQESENN